MWSCWSKVCQEIRRTIIVMDVMDYFFTGAGEVKYLRALVESGLT